MALNVLGSPLKACCFEPMTGFYRDGYCHTGVDDRGQHTVCVRVTEKFLQFSASRGNDLSTAFPIYDFPGLKPGDQWCLCVERWMEAYEAGFAPPVVLESTHASVVEWVDIEILKRFAVH